MGKGGGVSVYSHKSLGIPKNVESIEFFNSNYLSMYFEKLNLNIAVMYRESKTPLKGFLDFLNGQLEKIPGSLLIGDFNLNLLNEEYCRDYLNILKSKGFFLLNRVDPDSYTCENRFGKTIIDHAFTDLTGCNFKVGVSSLSLSDHRSLLVSFEKPFIPAKKKITKYNYSKINSEFSSFIQNETEPKLQTVIEKIAQITEANS